MKLKYSVQNVTFNNRAISTLATFLLEWMVRKLTAKNKIHNFQTLGYFCEKQLNDNF